MIRRPPRSPLFPSTTLSRSQELRAAATPPAQRSSGLPYRAASASHTAGDVQVAATTTATAGTPSNPAGPNIRSEEHTSELQSQSNLVCRLLLEKKKHTNLLIPLYKLYPLKVNFILSASYYYRDLSTTISTSCMVVNRRLTHGVYCFRLV